MYKVLLVDDEPIILSGLKFMLDWTSVECELIGAARNGKQALEIIDSLHPDIVITDISMPVLNGLGLLRAVRETRPHIVFIMLTNLQEFDLVQEALRLGAVDYLTKTQLDEDTLRQSLHVARKKAWERRHLAEASAVREDAERQRQEHLRAACRRMAGNAPLPDVYAELLREEGVWDGYGVAQIWLPPADPEEYRRLFLWETEMVEALARSCYERHVLAETEHRRMTLLHWGALPGDDVFSEKLSAVSRNMIGLQPNILLAGPFRGELSLEACRSCLTALDGYHYLSGKPVLARDELPPIEYAPLGLHGIAARLRAELNSRNAAGCEALIDRIMDKGAKTAHEKAEMLWLCGELHAAAVGALAAQPGEHYFHDEALGVLDIGSIQTRDMALKWLEKLKNEILSLLEPLSPGHADFLEKARQYVLQNLSKRILLQDAAHYASISPAYLSALFKKEYGQNFVDFVNGTKMERACEMISQGSLRINEIGYMLGFDNADYFSKVFRRHVGMTPTEYQKEKKQRR